MLTLYEPKYEDLWFRQMMLADEDTMSYNHAWGGTIPFGEDKWRGWYDCWIADPDGKRYYRYLKNEDGQFVGEIAYHYDAEMQQEIANVMIYAKYRRRGYGGEALDLLCSAAKSNGVSVLYDDIAIDNPAVSLFLKHGFVEESRTEEIILLKKENTMPEKQKEHLISQSAVLSMGFTKSMTDKLLPSPVLKRNPHYASSAPMKLWREDDVRSAMETQEFQTMAAKAAARKAASAKAVETKRKNAEGIADNLIASIHVTRWDMPVLEEATLNAKQEWYLEHGNVDILSPNP